MTDAMEDRDTIAAYESNRSGYAEDWETQPIDGELHALFLEHLVPGTVADIGCGSGRDSAWLQAQGWSVRGYDATPALVAEARTRHPEVVFEVAALPELPGLPTFDNVVCETVIMHLSHEAALAGVQRMGELVHPGGRLYLSWRADREADWRDDRGRLYTRLAIHHVLDALPDFLVRFRREGESASSGRPVCRLFLERPNP